jgi:hypothetical protein
MRSLTRASRFLTGLVTCFAMDGCIPAGAPASAPQKAPGGMPDRLAGFADGPEALFSRCPDFRVGVVLCHRPE